MLLDIGGLQGSLLTTLISGIVLVKVMRMLMVCLDCQAFRERISNICLRIPLQQSVGLSAYNFDIRYRPGRSDADADGMSRLPGIQGEEQQHMSSNSIAAVCNVIHAHLYLETLCMRNDSVDQDVDQPGTQ